MPIIKRVEFNLWTDDNTNQKELFLSTETHYDMHDARNQE